MTKRTNLTGALILAGALSGAALVPASETGHPHWSYRGEDGADKWGELSREFAACKLGKEQSPIDINSRRAVKAKLEKIAFHYAPSHLSIQNNGHTIQVDYDKGSHIAVGKDRYDLVQFHFHTPSEEEIDGREFEMVAHLVHRSAAGKLAVVAVLFDRGPENAFLKSFWDRLPADVGHPRTDPRVSIRVADLLPADRAYYTFSGSLTTPPCSEGVRWFVLKNPVTLSKEQKAEFKKFHALNNRPVQPLGGRIVQEGG